MEQPTIDLEDPLMPHLVSHPAPLLDGELQDDPLLAGLRASVVGHFRQATGHHTVRPAGLAAEHVLILCTAGLGWFAVAGRRRTIAAGDLLIAPAGVAHGYGADAERPWTIRYAHLLGSECPQWWDLLALPARGWSLSLRATPRADALLLDALAVYHAQAGRAALVQVATRLRQLLALALGETVQPPAQDRIGRALTWMQANLDAELDLPALAARSGWSASHFNRRFRAVTGQSPLAFFIRLRMHRAAELLAGTGSPIAAVARQLGYEDPYYFSRLFRQVIGRPPSAQRGMGRACLPDNTG